MEILVLIVVILAIMAIKKIGWATLHPIQASKQVGGCTLGCLRQILYFIVGLIVLGLIGHVLSQYY